MLIGAPGDAVLALHAPFREQREFAAQQRVVIGRQTARVDALLPVHQRGRRRTHQAIDAGGVGRGHGLLQLGEVEPGAEVTQQQESMGGILRQHLRGVQSGRGDQAGHVHEGTNVFVVGRRIHHDAAAARPVDAQVAAKARIAGGRAQGGRQQTVGCRERCQPALEGVAAVVVCPDHGLRGVVAGVVHRVAVPELSGGLRVCAHPPSWIIDFTNRCSRSWRTPPLRLLLSVFAAPLTCLFIAFRRPGCRRGSPLRMASRAVGHRAGHRRGSGLRAMGPAHRLGTCA